MTVQVFSDGSDVYSVRDPGAYSLSFLGGDDTLTVRGGDGTTASMGDGADYVRLLAGLASITGDGGADIFNIWASGATLYGGDGNDLFCFRDAASGVSADGGADSDRFIGSGFAVSGTLYGGSGNDYFLDFDGRAGLTIYGGTGNDVYRVWDAHPARFIEAADEGSDAVQLARGIDFVLPDNIEKVVVGNYWGYSVAAATITGNSGNNIVIGSANAETVYGLDGSDHLYGKSGDDDLWGGSGNDLLDGGSGGDWLQGEAGDDILIGRAGDDRLIGGSGNDSYYVDSVGDVVVENAGEGVDTIRTTVDLTLPDAVENAIVWSSAGLTIYGNLLDNRLTGGAGDDCIFASDGNDVVIGGAGNDYLGGEFGNDVISGGAGNDYLFGDEGNDRVSGGDGADYVQGYSGDDVLDGGNGSDLLAGGPGCDKLTGGAGSDTFLYYEAAESVPGAFDIVRDFTSLQGEGADDQIDLSLIDANVSLDGDQAFVRIGTSAAANSLWYSEQVGAGGAQDWVFYGDTDGNPATVEFELHVHSLLGAVCFDDITL